MAQVPRVFVVEVSRRSIEKLRTDSLTLNRNFEFSGGSLSRLGVRLNVSFTGLIVQGNWQLKD